MSTFQINNRMYRNTLSVIGVGVTTRVHVAGPLFDDFFYTDRAEI